MDSEEWTDAKAGRVESSVDRRTILSENRTVFATELTYAAWVRTALVALVGGVGVVAALG
ncbi:hypothetical protein [Lichenifustis flavocetrariae]|uniref:DUF202 domain-containing protein n=1 Tax=Lichenifustis flavocetrariae TaxID=2949735 RepID=A0AA42CLU6_9HYPH|nr:hypothetical protein [Lichenifustis flavocetrariae]MCW6507757.1 hypothetical protein [Lichenifustis flavocetrariae]